MVVQLENIRGSLVKLNQKNSIRQQYIKLAWPHIHNYQLILIVVVKNLIYNSSKENEILRNKLERIAQKFPTFLMASGRLEQDDCIIISKLNAIPQKVPRNFLLMKIDSLVFSYLEKQTYKNSQKETKKGKTSRRDFYQTLKHVLYNLYPLKKGSYCHTNKIEQ